MATNDSKTINIELTNRQRELLSIALDLLIASLGREHTKLMKIGRRSSADVTIAEQTEVRSLALKVNT